MLPLTPIPRLARDRHLSPAGEREPRVVVLGLICVALSGCFFRAQAGYQTALPGTDPGGGQLEVSAGLGDMRNTGHPAAPIQYGLDFVGHAGTSGHRFGFGLSTLFAPLHGWDHNWSPTVRLGGRLLQIEWLPKDGGSVSGFTSIRLPARASCSSTTATTPIPHR